MKDVFKLKLLFLLFIFTSCTSPQAAGIYSEGPVYEQPGKSIVYITSTGKKYHRENCRYLKYSKVKTSLREAEKNGYKACKVCRP